MAEILQFPSKKQSKQTKQSKSKLSVEEIDAIEKHRIKLMSLFADLQHIIQEINYHKQVIKMLESGTKK